MFVVEIPPTYDDTFEPTESDLDSSGQWSSRGPRHTDRYGSLPANQPGVALPADKSGSLQHNRPLHLKNRRHYSDVTAHGRKRYVGLLIVFTCNTSAVR